MNLQLVVLVYTPGSHLCHSSSSHAHSSLHSSHHGAWGLLLRPHNRYAKEPAHIRRGHMTWGHGGCLYVDWYPWTHGREQRVFEAEAFIRIFIQSYPESFLFPQKEKKNHRKHKSQGNQNCNLIGPGLQRVGIKL